MAGLYEALSRGAADSRSADQLRAQQAQQAALLAMQQETHAQNMRQGQLQIDESQGRADAMGQLRGLQNRDEANRRGMEEDINRPGGGLPQYLRNDFQGDATEREYNRAYGGVAASRGDLKGAQGFQQQNKLLDVQDTAKRLSENPEWRSKVMDHIHKDNRFLGKYEPAKFDKNGRQLTAAAFDLQGQKVELSPQDEQGIAYGVALMKHGMTQEGLAHISGVNKEIGAMIAKANGNLTGAAKENREGINDLENNRLRAEQMRLLAAQRAAANSNRNREVPPELLKQYNALVAEHSAAVDAGDTVRANALMQKMSALEPAIANSVGKVMQPRDMNPRAASVETYLKALEQGQMMFPPDKNKPNSELWGRTWADFETGRQTPQMLAERLKDAPPEVRQQNLSQLQMIHPRAAQATQALLQRMSPQTTAPAAPQKKAGIPPPIVGGSSAPPDIAARGVPTPRGQTPSQVPWSRFPPGSVMERLSRPTSEADNSAGAQAPWSSFPRGSLMEWMNRPADQGYGR